MKVYDCHVHTLYSCDGKDSPLELCLAAQRKRLSGIVFTDHLELGPGDMCYGFFKASEAVEAYRLASEKCYIPVGYGLEITYDSSGAGRVARAVKKLSPLFRIGGVHYVEDTLIDHWFGRAPSLEPYLREVLACASSGLFHALAHLDYFNKKTTRFRNYTMEHRALVDEIITALLDTKTLPEVNTSSLRANHIHPMPGPDFLELYKKAGGREVYLGSDAHASEDVCAGFSGAMAMLRELGLSVAQPPGSCFAL